MSENMEKRCLEAEAKVKFLENVNAILSDQAQNSDQRCLEAEARVRVLERKFIAKYQSASSWSSSWSGSHHATHAARCKSPAGHQRIPGKNECYCGKLVFGEDGRIVFAAMPGNFGPCALCGEVITEDCYQMTIDEKCVRVHHACFDEANKSPDFDEASNQGKPLATTWRDKPPLL